MHDPTSPIDDVIWQPSLLATGTVDVDRSFSALERIHLDGRSWVDHAPGWISGADVLFQEVPRTSSTV